jgi:hypothetical protein
MNKLGSCPEPVLMSIRNIKEVFGLILSTSALAAEVYTFFARSE